jgi:hypothetical protein
MGAVEVIEITLLGHGKGHGIGGVKTLASYHKGPNSGVFQGGILELQGVFHGSGRLQFRAPDASPENERQINAPLRMSSDGFP